MKPTCQRPETVAVTCTTPADEAAARASAEPSTAPSRQATTRTTGMPTAPTIMTIAAHHGFKRVHLALSLAGLLCLPALAAPSSLGCLIEAERTADVGSPVIGVVERIEVERGDRVSKGQVLAVLKSGVERAALKVATTRAESDADLKAAAASAEFNRKKLERARDLFQKEFVAQQAVDQARAEADLADQKLVQTREQRGLARQERDLAAAQLELRVIRSPIDGVVAERYVWPGERVDDKPLLRIAKVDPLRVQLVVPVAMYSQVQLGGLASVMPEFPGATALSARVTMIDKVADPASNTFRVHLEMPNRDAALPAGLRCKADFGAGPAAQNATPPSNAVNAAGAVVPVAATAGATSVQAAAQPAHAAVPAITPAPTPARVHQGRVIEANAN